MSDKEQVDDQDDARDEDQTDQEDEDRESSSKDETLRKVSDERRKARERAQKAESELKDVKSQLAKLTKDAAAREEAEATEKGEFEKLANDRAAKIAELEQQLKDRDAKDTKAAIAKKHGIPEDLISLLQGETEDEIDESAKTVAKHLKVRDTTDIDAGEKSGSKGREKAEADKKTFADPARWGLRTR